MLIWLPLFGVWLCGPGGCHRPAEYERLDSANPLDRARAVVRAAENNDAEAVHKLVDLLEDPDDAVRMYAIMGLRRLCGEDYGYRYYAAPGARAAAVQRWRAALRAGEVVARAAPASDTGREQPTSSGSLRP